MGVSLGKLSFVAEHCMQALQSAHVSYSYTEASCWAGRELKGINDIEISLFSPLLLYLKIFVIEKFRSFVI